jgi:oxaloacetate decarboxylase alpha subunit
LDEVLEEIPRVREDLGFIPLVTPTSQIVGTQAVINILSGERYKTITKETAGVVKGEYGKTPASLDAQLLAKVLENGSAITCRPADNIEPEVESLTVELKDLADSKGIRLAENVIDDVLTYALFPRVGLKFLENRDNPDAFEPLPSAGEPLPPPSTTGTQLSTPSTYTVRVNGKSFTVEVAQGGALASVQPAAASAAGNVGAGAVAAALAGNIFKVLVAPGDAVSEGQTLLVLEAMKMEADVVAPRAGTVSEIFVAEGDAVAVGDPLLAIG